MRFMTLLLLALPALPCHGETPLRFLGWNLESEGNAPPVIARQLAALQGYDVYALTEVAPENFQRYGSAIRNASGRPFQWITTVTGNKDRMMIVYDSNRIQLRDHYELVEHDGMRLNDESLRYRSPLVAEFRDKKTGVVFDFVVNHLARGKAKFRQIQARGLRRWATGKQRPTLAMGDYNFDFDFRTQRGNTAFDEFLANGVWQWIRPAKLVDTNWYDRQGDGQDDYPDSLLDFAFVSGAATNWQATSRVIVRKSDFPDNDQTSDHRPLELVIQPVARAPR